jgi:hypothetical protein
MDKVLQNFMALALRVFFRGLLAAAEDGISDLDYNLNCQDLGGKHVWGKGADFYRCRSKQMQLFLIQTVYNFRVPTGECKVSRCPTLTAPRVSSTPTDRWPAPS